MRSVKALAVAVTTAAALGGTTACGDPGSQRVAQSPRTAAVTVAPSDSGLRVTTERVRTYASLAELKKDSEVVVIAKALSGPTVQTLGELPFTRTQVKPITTVKGAAAGTLTVRQTGSAGWPADESGRSAILQPGETYLLYLRPFVLPGVAQPDEYVVVGDTAGVYRGAGSSFQALVPSARDSLPTTVTTAVAERD